jgi:hypothetical protein
MIESIALFAENATDLVLGTNLFAGYRPPDAQDDCVAILERVPAMDNPMTPGFLQKPIQILGRATDYYSARALTMLVYNVFFGRDVAGSDLPIVVSGDILWRLLIATGTEPAYIGKDDNGRYEFSSNLILRLQETQEEE